MRTTSQRYPVGKRKGTSLITFFVCFPTFYLEYWSLQLLALCQYVWLCCGMMS